MTQHDIARRFGCTLAQLRAQHLDNAQQARRQADRIGNTGRKIGGRTAAQWLEAATRSEEFARQCGA